MVALTGHSCMYLRAAARPGARNLPETGGRHTVGRRPIRRAAMIRKPLSMAADQRGRKNMDRQEEFVLRTLEERDIRFVRLWFTDVLGFLKSVAVAPAELEGAFAEGIGFDGSAVEGFARVTEADMLARPDPSTFQILPWRGDGP